MEKVTDHCKIPESLIDALDYLNQDSKSKWVFRGVENSKYGLTPSIFRKPKVIQNWLGISEPFPKKFEDQIRNEIILLQKYFSSANQIGLQIPGNWQYVLDYNYAQWEPLSIESSSSYSFKNISESMALAQHYGIPTRLLDFTFSYEVAIYFACKDMIELVVQRAEGTRTPITEVKNASVWAINLAKIENRPKSPIDHFVTPYCNNSYIKSQKGLFVVQKKFKEIWEASQPALAKRPDDYDKSMLNIYNCLKESFGDDVDDVIKRFTFSDSIKLELLDKLNSKGVNFFTLMPSFDNVTKYLMMHPSFDAEKGNYQRSLQIHEQLAKEMRAYMEENSRKAENDSIDEDDPTQGI